MSRACTESQLCPWSDAVCCHGFDLIHEGALSLRVASNDHDTEGVVNECSL